VPPRARAKRSLDWVYDGRKTGIAVGHFSTPKLAKAKISEVLFGLLGETPIQHQKAVLTPE
jgi:hypothetical protein